jgi:sulfur-oxidizing protein SoxA
MALALAGLTLTANARVGDPPQSQVSQKKQAVSGYAFQSAETRALQDDDFANPGMLWVDQGRTLWREQTSASSCASCHGDAADSMRGVAARLPRYDAESDGLLNLEGLINRCRTRQQQQPAYAYDSNELLSLSAFVAHQSRGLPIQVSIQGAAQAFFEAGREYFYARRGQMNLACHHCHELHAGQMLRGDRLSQGQATGYPTYRLEWQSLGSLHRRLRVCNIGVGAEPFDAGSVEYLELELFLAWRARGLAMETPAVRR